MPITGPRFFGWVMGASHPAGVAADFLVAAWGQNTGFHTPDAGDLRASRRSPSAGCSSCSTCRATAPSGFAPARPSPTASASPRRAPARCSSAGWDPDADGLFGAPPVHVLIGADAHSSLFSSLQLIGFGYKRVINDRHRRRRAACCPRRSKPRSPSSAAPRSSSRRPGRSTPACFDPFTEIARIAKAHDAWLHVDGAFGLWARATRRAGI